MNASPFEMDFLDGRTARDVIDYWAETQPDGVFLIDPIKDCAISYAELRKYCRSIASYLVGKGLRKGNRVGYAMHNGPDAALTILGALYGGFVATAINLVSGANTISYVLHHSGARHVVCQKNTLALLKDATDRGIHSLFDAISEDHFNMFDDDAWLPELSINDNALLMYTSGTTGVPKGVVHSHQSLLAGGGQYSACSPIIHCGPWSLCSATLSY